MPKQVLRAVALVILATACSHPSSGAGVARGGSKPGGQGSAAAGEPLAFAACMRSHGVPNYPDPPRALPSGVDPNSPHFQAAQRACDTLLSQRSTSYTAQEVAGRQKAALVWAACMRSHGAPKFPDPVITTIGNALAVGMDLSRTDVSSPQFQVAAKACQRLPGAQPLAPPRGNPAGGGGSGP